ncbi:MFS transporter [Neobacillus vireti]|uniref:MFS transporter n=1 Tax=Neobacillus vireti TaxID=220686 RepID=UPI002FFE169F
MTEKVKDQNSQRLSEGLWRVLMFPLGSASSNIFLFFNNLFFMVFCTEALKMNPVTTGMVLTVTRMIDGWIDPVVGTIIDRTETRFGKFRPFLVGGTIVMVISMLMMYHVSFMLPDGGQLAWMVAWDTIFVIGYSFVTIVNKSVLSIVTKNPNQRPASGIAGGIYSTSLNAFMGSFVAIVIQEQGGFQVQNAWLYGILIAIGANLVIMLTALIPIWTRDTPEYYNRDEARASNEKPNIKDFIKVIKVNRPLQMLMIASSMNRLSEGVASAALMYFFMYTYKDLDIQPMVSGVTAPVGLIGAFVVGLIAVKVGSKNAYLLGTFGNIIVSAILLIWQPFSPELSTIFLALMVMDTLFKRFNNQNLDPMIADVIDYHQYKTGRYLPGAVSSSFSFIQQFFSSFSGSITGFVLGAAGYAAGVEPTATLYWSVLALYFGVPMLGDIISAIALKFYVIDNRFYKKMYVNGKLVLEADTLENNCSTRNKSEELVINS